MDIEEVEPQQQDDNKQISQNQTVSESDKIVQANIVKYNRKRRVKVQWYPKIPTKQLATNSEPTYIYFLMKIFKSYDDNEYNKHRYFGYADAGVGMIDRLSLDKVYETVDMSLHLFSTGLDNYKQLIKFYRSQQDQMYYNLSSLLEEYQDWTKSHLNSIYSHFSDKKIYNEEFQEQLCSAMPEYELAVKQWVHEHYPNDLFEIELGFINVESAKPVIKKKIFSKNLMMFIGGDLYQIYQKLIEYNLKECFQSFLSGGEYNGRLQLEKVITMIKVRMNSQKSGEKDSIVIDDEVFTFDGLTIPTQKTMKVFFYNYKENKISQKPTFHFFVITFYNFEPHWIRYLIETREKFSQAPKQIGYSENDQVISTNSSFKNFDYICQQEYFLEKFNYIKKYPTN